MKGFTLIEMLVSVAIFAFVVVIALGALLAISASDRKAESLKAVINNLNFSLDSMSRSIRTGYNYHCGSFGGGDCQSGSNFFAYTAADGTQVAYQLVSGSGNATVCGQTGSNIGCIVRSTDGGASWQPLTAPEVVVNDYSTSVPASYMFYLVGSIPQSQNDPISAQPKVNILISGAVVLTPTQQSKFNLQTTVTQRIYDQ
ncbi:MAG: prepilin-type N-terminal cleavage/methylation domain-containing protein [Patescibacteria group bacterium]|nr:prepilin-type N-terminal cleavage/methylation domain-containing protein [Patescibacteria group bacterium]